MTANIKTKAELFFVMILFGTIGVFVTEIPLSSGMIAAVRGLFGATFLTVILLLRGKRLDFKAIRRYLWRLLLSGACIGINWVLLFEAYRYTTVAVATLCYYFAPIFLLLASAIFIREKLTVRAGISLAVALLGMVLVSGVLESTFSTNGGFVGVLLGLGAALFYTTVILLNKGLRKISSYDSTIVQLLAAAVVVTPYALLTQDFSAAVWDLKTLLLLGVVALLHTGIAYALYFHAVGALRAQTVAVYSYIDPVTAVLLSTLFLREPLTPLATVGAVLILASTFYGEIFGRKRDNKM